MLRIEESLHIVERVCKKKIVVTILAAKGSMNILL